ncbi:MAG: pyruvate dehydrogenase (acetyl-transferring) E1 component subunit alpha [Acidimicrobiia bacterium]|nr:pyruvate dehydrogenase (acetyl-transferring) E1 component subunit alpha [Acidimicrobiia bacterium]
MSTNRDHRGGGPGSLPALQPVQLLDPDGSRHEHPVYAIDISATELIDLYRLLAVTRAMDQEFVNLQRQGELALYAPCMGQEAAQIGLARGVEPTDWIFPQYRELGVIVERKVPLRPLGSYWRGRWHSGWDPFEHRIGPMTIPIATQLPHAVGYGMGIRLDGGDEIVVACLGDGATSEGDSHEAMNFAAVFGAPVIFFVQNNQWAISVPESEQHHAASLAHKAIGYGMTGVRCDGNDVLATLAVVRHHAEQVRAGAPPVLVEAVTYRRGPHTTSDDPTRYRSDDDVVRWTALDPILRLERHLADIGALTTAISAAVTAASSEAALEVREALFESPDTDPLELFDHVFADPPDHLIAQQNQLSLEIDAALDAGQATDGPGV